jgi:chorismate--pyruvate lyase
MYPNLPNHWRSYQSLGSHLSPQWKDWLLTSESLTARLKQRSKTFRVNLKFQGYKKPYYLETAILKLNHTIALVREVDLICDEKVCVSARSIIPLKTLQSNRFCFKNLGSRPLIELLAQDPKLKRTAFEITQMSLNAKKIWGRRSIFYWFNQSILVTEYFQPEILNLPDR